jgi:acyl carrier protein
MSDIGDRVKKIVIEHLGVEEAKVTDTASSSTIWARTAWIRSNS